MSDSDDTVADTLAPERGAAPGIEERKWAFFAHLSALSGFIVPFGNLLGPLIVWQIKKDEMPFAAQQAKEALNFQITVCLAITACFVLFVVVIGFFLLPVVAIGALVLTVIAAVSANDGKAYRYPFTLRLVS
jgi:uncharacterized Tic20 family protein